MSGLARQAAAYPNPRVAVTHEPLFEGGDRQAESYFNLSQRIEWPSLRLARTEAGNRLAQAAVHQVRVDSLRLAFEVAHVYIEAVAAEARTETLQSVAKIFRGAERVVVAREGEGDASGYDIRRLRVERARYETALAIANLNQHAIWRHLAILILPEGEGDEVGRRLHQVFRLVDWALKKLFSPPDYIARKLRLQRKKSKRHVLWSRRNMPLVSLHPHL